MKKLEWFALVEDWSGKEFKPYNVFTNFHILPGLYDIKKEYKKELKKYMEKVGNFNTASKIDKWKEKYKNEVFSEEVRKLFMWQYWSRSEYEVILTSWPTYMVKENLERLDKLRKENPDKKLYEVDLALEEKIDVYSQLNLNWDKFVDYVWNNLDLVKKC